MLLPLLTKSVYVTILIVAEGKILIQLEFREKPINPAVISTFLQVFLLCNTKN